MSSTNTKYLYLYMHGDCKSKDPQFLVVPKGITLYFMTSLGKLSFTSFEDHLGIFPDKMSGIPLEISIINNVKVVNYE